MLYVVTGMPAIGAGPQEGMVEYQGGKLLLSSYISIWVPDRDIPETEVISGLHDHEFKRPDLPYLVQDADNWVRFTIKNTSATEAGEWVLDLQSAMVSDAVLLMELPGGVVNRQEVGLRFSYEERTVPYNHFAFPVHQEASSEQTYYLKIRTPFQLYFAPALSDHASFLKTASINFAFGHLFIGLLIGVFVYLLVLYLGPESRVLVSRFIWFVFFAMLVILYVNGFLMAYLPANEWLATRLWVVLHVCMQTAYLLATQDFFQTQMRYPRIHYYLSACIISAGVFFVLIFFVPYPFLVKAELYFVAQLIIGITAISCYVWWKEKSKMALFAIGNLGLTFTAALSTFVALGSVAASDWVVQHGFEVGFCWQAVLFTWALSKKINLLATSAAIAEAESKAKSDFIAKMSHEIRTPMNGVLGMVQVLQHTPITTEQKHYLNVIDSSGKTLLAVINDILDYSKLMAGKAELHPQPFDLEELLCEINTLFGEIAHNKNLSFNIILSPDTPTLLTGDSIRLRQILTNLLSNAFKFTHHGMILLKISAVEEEDFQSVDDEQLIVLQFKIKDTGIGISAEEQKQLFKEFSQLNSNIEHRHSGSGLGLAICKQLVEIMGGNIQVFSKKNAGAEFVFTVKLSLTRIHESESATRESLASFKKHVLVAEDNMINRDVICAFLKKLDCEVQTVSDGKAALEFVQQNPGAFDLILMDCEMPIMDGIGACYRLREYEKISGQKPIPVIALTAHVSTSQLRRCEEAGMDGYLIKPVSLSQLQEALSRVFS